MLNGIHHSLLLILIPDRSSKRKPDYIPGTGINTGSTQNTFSLFHVAQFHHRENIKRLGTFFRAMPATDAVF